jgi:aminocarboxymuconate-semialdehyde decarboxylase
MAELVDRYPDRFAGFAACLPMYHPAQSACKSDRSLRDLGARGVQIFSNVNGLPLPG